MEKNEINSHVVSEALSEAELRPAVPKKLQRLLDQAPPELRRVNDGALVVDGVLYGTKEYFSYLMGIPVSIFNHRLFKEQFRDVQPLEIINKLGRSIHYYAESRIYKALMNYLTVFNSIPHCDKDGFAMVNGVHYALKNTLRRSFGVTTNRISDVIEEYKIKPIEGQGANGRRSFIYPEDKVRRSLNVFLARSNLLSGRRIKKLDQLDDEFLTLQREMIRSALERHDYDLRATAKELGIQRAKLVLRLQQSYPEFMLNLEMRKKACSKKKKR